MRTQRLEAEQSVIGSVLADNRALEAAQPLASSDFAHAQHQLIWAAMGRMAARHYPIDAITLQTELGASYAAAGGQAYIDAIAAAMPSARNVRRYAEIVREASARRAIIAAAEAMIEGARDSDSIDAVLNCAGTAMSSIMRGQTKRAPRYLAEIAAERTAYYERLKAGEEQSGWPTGIAGLDAALNGGIRPGKLYFVGARPAVGKSSLSAQILLELAQAGHCGLFLSQEMSAEEVADRAVSNVGRIEYGRLQTGNLSDRDWGRAVEMLERMATMPVLVDDQGSLTIADIRAKVRSVPGLRVVVLDYLQLCARSDGSSGANRNAEIEEISRRLKALAMEMQIAIICLSQLNRNVEQRAGGRPVLADLRDSGSIEQDADAVFLLWPVRENEGSKLTGLNVAKNRQGRCTEIALDFAGSVQRWSESSESLDQPQQSKQVQSRGMR